MKQTITKWAFTIMALFIISFGAKAQEEVKGLKQLFDVTLDELGNASVAVSMKLNASQWAAFKQYVGNNTSNLKRSMEDALPKYILTNFKYSEEEMNRTYTMKFDVNGIVKNDKNGKWTASLDTKDPDVTKLSDKEFIISQDIVSNGALLQQTQKLHLPARASGAKIEKDSFGKAILTYNIGTPVKHTIISALGVLMILGGGFFFYRNGRSKQNNLKVAKDPVAA